MLLFWCAETLTQICCQTNFISELCWCNMPEWGLVKCLPDVSRNTVLHLAEGPACFLLSSYHTSICSIELNAKVSVGSTRAMAGSEDDATDGFVFPDHTGDCRRGHYPMVSNDQTTHLRKRWLVWICILNCLSGGGVRMPLNIRFGVSCFFQRVTRISLNERQLRHIKSKSCHV